MSMRITLTVVVEVDEDGYRGGGAYADESIAIEDRSIERIIAEEIQSNLESLDGVLRVSVVST
jgi:hypothetical protein